MNKYAQQDTEEIKKFIKQTHFIENEDVDGDLVDKWVDFAYGKSTSPPQDRDQRITGHIQLLQEGKTPVTIQDVERMYTMIGETGTLRGRGQEVKSYGTGTKYTPGINVQDALQKWLDEYQGKMGTLESHKAFEQIHPGIDGNGRVGRLILVNGGYPLSDLNNLIRSKSTYIERLMEASDMKYRVVLSYINKDNICQ